jgi:predicted dehydrogenase
MAKSARQIRYAVVGLGWIAQEVVLPAFFHAKNSRLAALVSDDATKLKKLGDMYEVQARYSYKEYRTCLESGTIDAVFIALPNAMHRDYTVAAANAGVHVLCEKPMAMDERECRDMVDAAHKNRVKLMIAYRLHFEEGNLKAAELVRRGKLGDVRLFNSTFSMNVQSGNVRLDEKLTGGTLYDIGIYCINAARAAFREEPQEVFAVTSRGRQKRFRDVDEMTAAVLRFSEGRIAQFICSFGAASVSAYEIVGTKGSLRVDPAFHHKGAVKHTLVLDGKVKNSVFPSRDQFAAELFYFSKCILQDREPEPSGREGLADVRIINALYASAQSGRPVKLKDFDKRRRPTLRQSIRKPDAGVPRMVKVKGPSK